jgi:hypothetical protein
MISAVEHSIAVLPVDPVVPVVDDPPLEVLSLVAVVPLVVSVPPLALTPWVVEDELPVPVVVGDPVVLVVEPPDPAVPDPAAGASKSGLILAQSTTAKTITVVARSRTTDYA